MAVPIPAPHPMAPVVQQNRPPAGPAARTVQASVVQTMDFRTPDAVIDDGINKINVKNYIFGNNEDEDHIFADLLKYHLNSGLYFGGKKQQIADAIARYKVCYPAGKSKRVLFGYVNPSHKSTVGLSLLEDGAHTPYDNSRWNTKADWLLSPSRNFHTSSPTTHTRDAALTQGHSHVVFGHDMGASVHFNSTGHTQTVEKNKKWNQQKSTYHGLENYKASAQSGSLAPTYMTPVSKADRAG